MISVAEALAQVLALIEPTETEEIPLDQAVDRALAAPITAKRAQPPFPASAMDGYAVRAADLNGQPLTVIGEAAAGTHFARKVGLAQAVRI
ncbi:MAG: molybdopterin molybdenumtransferase MoeA, partial [Pseudomonadota bacterium]